MKIIFIVSCSGTVPECSGMLRVPGFIDARRKVARLLNRLIQLDVSDKSLVQCKLFI